MTRQAKPPKPFFDAGKLGAFGLVFWVPLVVTVLVSQVALAGETGIATAVWWLSEGVAGRLPMIDTIAESRRDTAGIRAALVAAIGFQPFLFVYLLFKMSRSVRPERPTGLALLKLIGSLTWFIAFFAFVVFAQLYAVLPAAGPELSGRMIETYDPLFEIPAVAATSFFFVLYISTTLASAWLWMLGTLASDSFSARGQNRGRGA
ncbi:hypothetical protein TK90_0111 [Thioalkalivibrio sp. K90mix]|uniref:hypothetical protein n=2 Tax=unclassified Thioalkalivibrio TaxID=2621013 RepID=UPI000195A6DE|nr:hypothetical protein [Thioalkalivibrio sp. K90mix]ADC70627.1 hypothetical protein TK90_0111 [Thioalkalivibrio sp. K90mix]